MVVPAGFVHKTDIAKLYIKNREFTRSSIRWHLDDIDIDVSKHYFDHLTDNIYRLFYTKQYLQTNKLSGFPGVCNIILMYIRPRRTTRIFKYNTDISAVFSDSPIFDGLLDVVWK